MTENNKWGPTRLRRLQREVVRLQRGVLLLYYLAYLAVANPVLAILAAALSVLFTVGASLAVFFALKAVPTVYTVMIATAVGLAIAISFGSVVYRWRVAVKRNMIRELRTTEADLFQRIEARLPDLLGGKL
jgi:glucan phosphoethanolaminetransferase (alkaline phosphatase superfamily)